MRKDVVAIQDKARLDPDLVMAWFTLLSQFPVSFQASWVSEVEKVVIQNFGFARALLGRKEEDLLRSTIAFLRSALVCTPPSPCYQCTKDYSQSNN